MTIEGRAALVTGGSRGIGRAIARTLTAAGAHVTVAGRNAATLQTVVAAGEAEAALCADVTAPETLRAIEARPIDILVANAGSSVSAPFGKTDDRMFRDMIDTNVMGVVHVIRAVLPGMQQRRHGRIVVIGSTASLKGYAYVTAYAAAKHAVLGLVRSLALETAQQGITVNAVCPGYVDTEMTAESIDRIIAKTGRGRDEAASALVKANPQQRLIAPDEVASAVLWLCGSGAASVTGQAIAVSGGEV
jgi:NAD(P)-dependent dehydrogenase (short-subunit alcohol dehydrogenase family)